MIFLLPVFFLFFISIVSAAPPQATTEGWIVRSAIPDTIVYEEGIAYDFHAHVFDATTGNPIFSACSCDIHIYDFDGTHLFEGTDDTASHTYDYGWDVEEANFSIGVEYPYILQCNGTYATDDEGGFYSGTFEVVNNSNTNIDTFWVIIFAIIIALALILIGFAREEHPPITIGSIILMVTALYIWVNGFGTLTATDLIPRFIAAGLFVVGAVLTIKSLSELK